MGASWTPGVQARRLLRVLPSWTHSAAAPTYATTSDADVGQRRRRAGENPSSDDDTNHAPALTPCSHSHSCCPGRMRRHAQSLPRAAGRMPQALLRDGSRWCRAVHVRQPGVPNAPLRPTVWLRRPFQHEQVSQGPSRARAPTDDHGAVVRWYSWVGSPGAGLEPGRRPGRQPAGNEAPAGRAEQRFVLAPPSRAAQR